MEWEDQLPGCPHSRCRAKKESAECRSLLELSRSLPDLANKVLVTVTGSVLGTFLRLLHFGIEDLYGTVIDAVLGFDEGQLYLCLFNSSGCIYRLHFYNLVYPTTGHCYCPVHGLGDHPSENRSPIENGLDQLSCNLRHGFDFDFRNFNRQFHW